MGASSRLTQTHRKRNESGRWRPCQGNSRSLANNKLSRSEAQLRNEFKKGSRTLDGRATKGYCWKGSRGHGIEELVKDTISSFTGESLSAKQIAAVAELKQWYSRWRGPAAGRGPMIQALRILNDVFFMGKLPCISFAWCTDEQLIRHETEKFEPPYGLTSTCMIRLKRKVPQYWWQLAVFVNKRDYHMEKRGATDAKAAHFGTFLHECVHAYLEHFECVWHGCVDKKCIEVCKITIGKTGHGTAFLSLAAAIQLATLKYLDLDIKLGVLNALLYEESESDCELSMDLCECYFSSSDFHNQAIEIEISEGIQYNAELDQRRKAEAQENRDAAAELPFHDVEDEYARFTEEMEQQVIVMTAIVIYYLIRMASLCR